MRLPPDLTRDDTAPRLIPCARRGDEEALQSEPRTYLAPRLSPDGARLAVVAERTPGNLAIWVREVEDGTLRRLTVTPDYAHSPVWTGDGRRVMFAGIL